MSLYLNRGSLARTSYVPPTILIVKSKYSNSDLYNISRRDILYSLSPRLEYTTSTIAGLRLNSSLTLA